MDLNAKIKILIDEKRLVTEVRQKAKEYLDDISEESLKSFAESTKYIAQTVLENYFLQVDKLYTSGVLKIRDQELFNKFIDFHDGYRAQMKQWASNNEIRIQELKVSPSLISPQVKSIKTSNQPKVILGVGTLIAVSLFIFTKVWIAVAAELLTIGAAAYAYKKSQKQQAEDYEFELKRYEMRIEQEKAHLVNGLLKDLKKWLNNAQQYSEEVLNKYGL